MSKKSNEESLMQMLRAEIKNLKEENKELKEKIIVFPKRTSEEISIRFFDENIEQVIIRNIHETQKEIFIAVAWFTSKTIMDELNNLKRRGINIKVIINNNESNKNFNTYKLMNVCSELKKVIMPKRKNTSYSNFMHNKYCIIDNEKVIDGSYNWSNNAKYNLEHIIVIESTVVAKMYKENFDKIYNNPKYYNFEEYNELG
ncbi:phospholipase D-like domain-containing protein [Clostridium botulinum]|uniref:phospholipase D-like domain-containing protein n=1 Tax=Clostridium botulinum TaxID=1491 RepID=UPI001C9B10D9|nr:phospholipase D-like domain-containing protein [Clostridium botulinum]MBY6917661.1 DUF1669 domain-containing protein [Clostridium botulinum]HBJ1646225.1 DUF1669 domain-containing protein [Clostridium botulinum]